MPDTLLLSSPNASAGASALKISPSLLSCDFARLAEEVRRVEDAGADWLHVDVMDGHFVPNLTIGPPVVAAIKQVARVPLDVHLMISEPLRYAAEYVKAGAEVLTLHAELFASPGELERALLALRAAGVRHPGVAINPDTPIEVLLPVLELADLLLVMSVQPGFGGQAFRPQVLDKTRALRLAGYRKWIEMDGGLNAQTLPLCAAAGADVFVAGSAIFGAKDMSATIRSFRAAAQAASAQGA